MIRKAEIQGLKQLVSYTSKNAVCHRFSESATLCSVAFLLRVSPKFLDSPSHEVALLKQRLHSIFTDSATLSLDPQSTGQRIIESFTEFDQACSGGSLDSIDSMFEVLYARRSLDPKDRHAGEICFPGGKLDAGEDELESCKREIIEEIGLDAHDWRRFRYLGKISDKHFAYLRSGKDVTISCLLFMVLDEDLQLRVNKDELDSAFWIPVSSFFNYDPHDIQPVETQMASGILLNGVSSKENNLAVTRADIRGRVTSTRKFTFRLPVIQHQLWGLTWLMTSSALQLWKNQYLSPQQQLKADELIKKAAIFDIATDNDELTKALNHDMQIRNKQFCLSR